MMTHPPRSESSHSVGGGGGTSSPPSSPSPSPTDDGRCPTMNVRVCLAGPRGRGRRRMTTRGAARRAVPFGFDPGEASSDFASLLRGIAVRLGVTAKESFSSDADPDADVGKLTLLLGGDHPLEDASEIDEGDFLVLDVGPALGDDGGGCVGAKDDGGRSRSDGDDDGDDDDDDDSDDGGDGDGDGDTESEGGGDDRAPSGDDDDSDDEVLDVTDELLAAREASRNRELDDAELVDSSSSSDGGDDDDDSDYEGAAGAPPRSDADSDSDGSDDILYVGEVDPDAGAGEAARGGARGRPAKRGNKRKRARSATGTTRKSCGGARGSPLEVVMDEEDVPAQPGRSPHGDGDGDGEDGGGEDGAGGESGATTTSASSSSDASNSVKNRILKLLNTGFHDTSNENEARNAMKLAQRLMRRHNLSQALLMKEREGRLSATEGELRGGMVTVGVRNRRTGEPLSQIGRWIHHLIPSVCTNFRVEAYTTVSRRRGTWRAAECGVTFYGIYGNCQLAAYTFKVATERISSMAAEFEPEVLGWSVGLGPGGLDGASSSSARSAAARRAAATRNSRLSYALGIARGIGDEVEESQRREEERRARKLMKARRRAAAAAAATRGGGVARAKAMYESSSSEDDNDSSDCGGDDGTGYDMGQGDENDGDARGGDAVGKKDDPPSSSRRLEELEREESAALILVEHHERIAKDILKEKGVKLSKGRRRGAIDLDSLAYHRGVEDSKEIDLNQRAIRK